MTFSGLRFAMKNLMLKVSVLSWPLTNGKRRKTEDESGSQSRQRARRMRRGINSHQSTSGLHSLKKYARICLLQITRIGASPISCSTGVFVFKYINVVSIYTLSDLGDLSNLIGSLSRTIKISNNERVLYNFYWHECMLDFNVLPRISYAKAFIQDVLTQSIPWKAFRHLINFKRKI